MAGSGEVYKRSDDRRAFRVEAGNGQVVATDGSPGDGSKASATSTLEHLMRGAYAGAITELD